MSAIISFLVSLKEVFSTIPVLVKLINSLIEKLEIYNKNKHEKKALERLEDKLSRNESVINELRLSDEAGQCSEIDKSQGLSGDGKTISGTNEGNVEHDKQT